jgi:hypothetical protein
MQEVNFLHSSLIKFILEFSPHTILLSHHIYLSPFWHLSKSIGYDIKKMKYRCGKKQQKDIAPKNHVLLWSHILLSNIIKLMSWLICISVYHFMNNDNYDELIILINFLKREKIIHLVEAIKSESFDTMSKNSLLKYWVL